LLPCETKRASMGCSASDSLENGANASKFQGCPAAATLLPLQEFNTLLANQLLIIIGLVALAIWVRVTIASTVTRSIINKGPEHYTTCLEELLREERMVTKGLIAHLQDLNDDFRARLQDAEDRMTRMEEVQRPFDSLQVHGSDFASTDGLLPAAAVRPSNKTACNTIEGDTRTPRRDMIAARATQPASGQTVLSLHSRACKEGLSQHGSGSGARTGHTTNPSGSRRWQSGSSDISAGSFARGRSPAVKPVDAGEELARRYRAVWGISPPESRTRGV
jgi:hypothetical protein